MSMFGNISRQSMAEEFKKKCEQLKRLECNKEQSLSFLIKFCEEEIRFCEHD